MSVGIVGLGYVGLPLAVTFAEAGVDTRTAPHTLDLRGVTHGLEPAGARQL